MTIRWKVRLALSSGDISDSFDRYDHHSVTFIATRTDDISCQETISALKLKNDPTLAELERRIEAHPHTLKRMRNKNMDFEELIDGGLLHARTFSHLTLLQLSKVKGRGRRRVKKVLILV